MQSTPFVLTQRDTQQTEVTAKAAHEAKCLFVYMFYFFSFFFSEEASHHLNDPHRGSLSPCLPFHYIL